MAIALHLNGFWNPVLAVNALSTKLDGITPFISPVLSESRYPPEAKRAQDAQLYIDQLRQGDHSIGQAYTLSQAFLALVRERRGDALEAWIAEAAASGLEALARFAQGLRDDLAAVKAGRTLPWSNGPVEGHVNRLKMLKRQGYGRAGVGLLRQRVMQAV